MLILIKTPEGESTLEVEPNDTIRDVKTKIQNKEGIQINKQILFVDGKPLEDSKKLSDYNIQGESVVCVAVRP